MRCEMTKKKGLLGLFQKKKADIHVFHDLKGFMDGTEPFFNLTEAENKKGLLVIGVGDLGGLVARSFHDIFVEAEYPVFHLGIGYLGTGSPKPSEMFISLGEKKAEIIRNYLNAYDLVEKNSETISTKINELIDKKAFYKIGLVFFGPDSLGVGGGLMISKLLLEKDIMPVPVLILPDKGASLMERFNSAVAMYKLGLGPLEASLNIPFILIDTNRYYLGQRVPADQISKLYPSKIARIIADIMFSTANKSEGFDVGYAEFSSLFYYLRGPALLSSISGKFAEIKNLEEFLSEYFEETVSAPLDPFKATRGYFVFQAPKQAVLAEEFLSVKKLFKESDTYWHFSTRDDDKFVFRSILTGLGAQKYIKEWIEETEKLTVKLKQQEIGTFTQGKPIHNIDKLGNMPADKADFEVEELKE